MRKYLSEYLEFIENETNKKNNDWEKLGEELLIKISFFQHERLIHLIVTLFFSLFMLISLALGMISPIFLIIFVLFLAFVLAYIYHYYFLETKVQYLYKIYDKIKSKIK